MRVSAVIPTLNAEEEISVLLRALTLQSMPLSEILVIDSSSEDNTVAIADTFANVRVKVIDRKSFNHGTTRHEAFLGTNGDFVCFFTQDAIPAGIDLVERLVTPMLNDSSIAMVSGRQLPKAEARPFERIVRDFNYPPKSNVRSIEDVSTLGMRAFMATDVVAAYRRDAYMQCGGFAPTNIDEDMLMAATFLREGWRVAYAADGEVYHSHNYTLKQQYARNFEHGYFLETHSELFEGVGEYGEGFRLVKRVTKELISQGKYIESVAFGFDCVARLMGNRAGRNAARKEGRERQ